MSMFDMVSPLLSTRIPGLNLLQQDDYYVPRTEFYDELLDNIRRLPERNEPGKWRKLGAIISGMGAGAGAQAIVGGQPIGFTFDEDRANAATQNYLYAPYYRKLRDLEERQNMILPGAKMENELNQQNRLLYDARRDRQLGYDRLNETARRNEDLDRAATERNRIADKNAESARIRALAYQLKQSLPNYDFITDEKDGMIYGVNKSNPLDIKPTGIKDTDLDDATRLMMQLRNAKELEELRTENDLKIVGARGEQARETKGTPSGSTTITGELPTQQRTRKVVRAEEFRRAHPELANWIKIKGNTVEVIKPTTGRTMFGIGGPNGPSKEEYDTIIKYIDEPAPPRRTTTRESTQSTRPAQSATSGTVRVRRKSDGRTGSMSAEAYAANADKYERIP